MSRLGKALVIWAGVPGASFFLLLNSERGGFQVVAPLPRAAFRTKALEVPVPHLSLRSCVNLSEGPNFSEPHLLRQD